MSRALHLEIIAVGEQGSPVARSLGGARGIALQQRLSNVALARAGQRDQSVGAFAEPLAPEFRAAAILIAPIRAREPVGEPEVAGARLHEQQRAEGLVALGVVGEPDITAENRLDAPRARRLVELDEPEGVREIGNRERGHSIRGRGVDRGVDSQRPVDDRELAVQAQVYENRCGHGCAPTLAAAPLRCPPRQSAVARSWSGPAALMAQT